MGCSGSTGDKSTPGQKPAKQDIRKDVKGEGMSKNKFIAENTGKIADTYDLEKKKLGEGSYGSVSKAKHKMLGTVRACKTISKAQMKNLDRFKQEINIMKMMDHPNIIKLYESFDDHRNIYLVMELAVGGELFDRIIEAGHFTEVQAAMLMQQIVRAIYYMHENHVCHRDLKPENLLLGRGESEGLVHLIDFGLAKRFRDPTSLQHIEYREGKIVKGTLRYASLSACRGAELSRRDDLEAVGYLLVYFLQGDLPWLKLPKAFSKRVQFEKLAQLKASTPVQDLCAELECQHEMVEYFNYCKGLAFKECPDYGYLRRLFTEAMARNGHSYDLVYDWSDKPMMCPGGASALDGPVRN
mmetsp:Transcript_8888/g.22394  ORF Transcript_8888/g.22394 Transcript_8888/m.22394 type:complete len:355 (+) Transcript_8888:126-1190(+)